jgi:hypothetical protein
MGAAMELYWFQKDLMDFLTQQVEKDFAAYIEFKTKGQAEPFPAVPFDLVVNHSPARLDEFLRSTSREKLVAVLSAIVVNRQQQDLAMIFNTLLRDERKPDGTIVYGFPWERPASEKEHGSVRGFTMDEAQEQFLAAMLPPDKPDLADRQRFLDYVMDLRMVRYRADVIGLLESHHFDSLAAALRRGTEAELNGILNEIADVNGAWNTTRIAEAISAIVSINNESDFVLVRNNHAPNIAELRSLTIGAGEELNLMAPSGGAGAAAFMARSGGAGAAAFMGRPSGAGGAAFMGRPALPGLPGLQPGDNGVYKLRTFQMQVKLNFDRLPVFLRGLISNSWRYRVQILDISPTETTLNRVTTPRFTGVPPVGGMTFGGRGMPPGGMGMPFGTGMPFGRGMPPARMGMPPARMGMPPGRMGMPFGPGMAFGGMGTQFARGISPRGFTPQPTQPAAGAGPPPRGRQREVPMFEVGNYVIVTLSGEGYQFSPLVAKYRSRLENRATPAARAPAARPAAPTGAR